MTELTKEDMGTLTCNGYTYEIARLECYFEHPGQLQWVDPVAMARLVLTEEAFEEWLAATPPEQQQPRWFMPKKPTKLEVIAELHGLTNEMRKRLGEGFRANDEFRIVGGWFPEGQRLYAWRIEGSSISLNGSLADKA